MDILWFLLSILVVLMLTISYLRNRRLYREIQEGNRELSTLYTVSATVSQSLKLEEILTNALDKILELMKIKGVAIRLLEEGSQELVLTAHRGFPPDFVRKESRIKIGECLCGRVAETGQSLLVDDLGKEPRATRGECLKLGGESMAIIPLEVRGKLLGIIYALSGQAHGFSSKEVDLLTAIGQQMGVAIENARLFARTDEELAKRVAQLSALLSSISSGVIATDLEGKVTIFNEAASYIFNLDPGSVRGRHYNLHFSPPNPIGQLLSQVLASQESRPREVSLSTRLRERAILNLSPSLVVDDNRVPRGAVVIIEDLTERRKMEERTRQAETLAALGEMAAQIAHEVKNPLGGIKLFASRLKKKLFKEKEAEELLNRIITGIDSLSDTVSSLTTFTQSIQVESKPIQIKEALEEALWLAADKIQAKQIQVVKTFSSDIPLAHFDLTLLRQAFLNLIINAVEAMELKGKLTISVDLVTGGVGLRTTSPRVQVKIMDTGCGMSPEVKKNIFHPFYTTKRGGTGLGLSIVRRIIEAHEGTIEVESEEGRGTTITVILPLKEGR